MFRVFVYKIIDLFDKYIVSPFFPLLILQLFLQEPTYPFLECLFICTFTSFAMRKRGILIVSSPIDWKDVD